jgi:hypothetical protein
MFAPSSDMVVGSPQGQAAVAQDREAQMVGGPDPRDATLSRRDDLIQGVTGQLASSTP